MLIAITLILFALGTLLITLTDYKLLGAITTTLGVATILFYNLGYELYKWLLNRKK